MRVDPERLTAARTLIQRIVAAARAALAPLARAFADLARAFHIGWQQPIGKCQLTVAARPDCRPNLRPRHRDRHRRR